MEDWEKELYEDDSPSVEFAGIMFLIAMVVAILVCGFILWVWW